MSFKLMPEELQKILADHRKWLRGEGGKRARLPDADLTRANLTDAEADFFAVLDAAPAEMPALLAASRAGKINGSTYEGDCACLVGTIANARGCSHREIQNLVPNPNRPAERLFLALSPGHTPDNHPIAQIVEGWIVEWTEKHEVAK